VDHHHRHERGGHGYGDAQERTTVLVLGAGFMGSAIAGELARRGCVVYVYDRDPLLAHNVHLAARKGYLETGREGGLVSLFAKVPSCVVSCHVCVVSCRVMLMVYTYDCN
jgi:NAD(P)-dependent dehydrogenase (short-subunit alcohol dehydrogenase family)